MTAARPMALPQGTYGRLRAPEQVRDGAGVDMTTIPRRSSWTCAFAGTNGPTRPSQRTNRSLAEDLDRAAVGIGTLWEIGDGLFASINALERENLDAFTPDGLVALADDRGSRGLFPGWAGAQAATNADEGASPRLAPRRELPAAGAIGLDRFTNLAGLNSSTGGQAAMDERVASVLAQR